MDYFNWNEEYGSSAQHNSQPVYEPRKNTFAIASCICGILALMTICTGVFPIPLGALSILFAVLSHRKGRALDNAAIAGITLSAIGLLFAVFIVGYVLKMLPSMLENDAFREQMNYTSQQMYGVDFDTVMEQYYDMGILERTGD